MTITAPIKRPIKQPIRASITPTSRLTAVLAIAATAGIVLATPVGAQTVASAGATSTSVASAPFCGIYWGSLPKVSSIGLSDAVISNVRSGQHDCYDRLVFDVQGPVGGYQVQYDPGHTMYSTSGDYPRGGAYLLIWINNVVVPRPAPSHASTAVVDPDEVTDVTGYRTFRQVKELIYGPQGPNGPKGDLFALGVRARLPFRVITLDGPGANSRLVIDVAHHW